MQVDKTMSMKLVQASKVVTVEASAETDAIIVKRVLDGDVDAFETIMRRHNQRLYRVARSILKDEDEAMDVVQESYVKAYYQLEAFRGPDGFASWLSRVVSNESLMRLRRSHRIKYTLDDPMYNDNDGPVSDIQPIDMIAAEQLRGLLEKAVDRLPVGNRCVYMMRAVQQLSTRETAQSLDVTEEVVKTRYLRAKKLMHKIFQEHIDKAGLSLHEFDGKRCDCIVSAVMERVK